MCSRGASLRQPLCRADQRPRRFIGKFEFAEDAASDVLTSADNTAGQDGSLVKMTERLREKMQRHGPDSPGALANPERDDYIRAAARRVVHRLAKVSPTDAYLDV